MPLLCLPLSVSNEGHFFVLNSCLMLNTSPHSDVVLEDIFLKDGGENNNKLQIVIILEENNATLLVTKNLYVLLQGSVIRRPIR